MHYQPRHREEGPVHEGLVNNKAQNINHCVRSIANGKSCLIGHWQLPHSLPFRHCACLHMHCGWLLANVWDVQ